MNSLRSASLIIIGLILLGAIIRSLISADYAVTVDETIQFDAKKSPMNYLAFHRKLGNNDIDKYQLIDIRKNTIFQKGHVPGAINIPYARLLKKEGLSQINKKKPILIYCSEEPKAATAALMLYQYGFKKVNYLPGGFHTIKQFVLEEFDPAHGFYSVEKQQYNYQNYIRTGLQNNTPSSKTDESASKGTIDVSGGC